MGAICHCPSMEPLFRLFLHMFSLGPQGWREEREDRFWFYQLHTFSSYSRDSEQLLLL